MSQDISTLSKYIGLAEQDIERQLREIQARQQPAAKSRQVDFNAVETLLCYGLFHLLDPHRFGGGNIHLVPQEAQKLAAFFRRSPASLTNKMLNLDGSRTHCPREEPLLFAYLGTQPDHYRALYQSIYTVARRLAIDEQAMPDFLGICTTRDEVYDLVGQDDLPASMSILLMDAQHEMETLKQQFKFKDGITEKLVERKIRLAQHRFARAVLKNCGERCVFCGFAPHALPGRSSLLRASHIKPWAVSTHRERVDVRNGLLACPMHDAAFDQGFLMVNGGYRIHRATVLQESVLKDPGVETYFGQQLYSVLSLPEHATFPASSYLEYHRMMVFKG